MTPTYPTLTSTYIFEVPVWYTIDWSVLIVDTFYQLSFPNMNEFYTNKTVLCLASFNLIVPLSFLLLTPQNKRKYQQKHSFANMAVLTLAILPAQFCQSHITLYHPPHQHSCSSKILYNRPDLSLIKVTKGQRL